MTNYGNTMAQHIGELCKQKNHAQDAFNDPMICTPCFEIMEAIRAKYREDHPAPPAVLVHIAVDTAGGRILPFMDEVEAVAAAQKVSGVVMSWPVSTDCREADNG